MTRPSATDAAACGLHARLRSATRTCHQRLEAALGLTEPEIGEGRVVHLLERFHGFHAAWEPALAGVIPDGIRLPRLKMSLLREDLSALGVSEARIRQLPRCRQASALCAGDDRAAGALYVIEGSTLGGRVINQAIQRAPWLGERELRYWNPYGEDTARRWQETLAYVEALPPGAWQPAIDSAVATFELLHGWFSSAAPEQRTR